MVLIRAALSAALIVLFSLNASAQNYTAPTLSGVRINPFQGSTTTSGTANWVQGCPIANCPPGTSENTGYYGMHWVQGSTTLGSAYPEWAAVDGLYVNTGQTNGQKVTRYIGAVQGAAGGTTWSLNTDVVRNGVPNGSPLGAVGSSSPGTPAAIAAGNGTIGYELDFTNWDQDLGIGGISFAVGQYIHNQGSYASLAGLYFDSAPQNSYSANTITGASWSGGVATYTTGAPSGVHVGDNVVISGMSPSGYNGTFFALSGTSGSAIKVAIASNPGTATVLGTLAAYQNFAWHNGVFLNGASVAEDNSFLETTGASYGYQAWGTHLSDFYANSTATNAININGTHSANDVIITDNATNGINITGAHTLGMVINGTIGNDGILVEGTVSGNSFFDGSNAPWGFQAAGTHSSADMYANGTSPIGLDINGTHSTDSLSITDSAPVGIAVGGSHSTADIDLSNSPSSTAIKINNGSTVCMAGTAGCLLHTGSALAYQPSGTPVALISDTGVITAQYVTLAPYTVGTLPVCYSGATGALAFVTDASSPTYNAALSGGSSTKTLAMCNGTSWTAH